MTVTVQTPAVHKELTTLLSVKNELGITGSSSDRELISFIEQASDWIGSYCGRTFAKETVVETRDASGGLFMVLTRRPIITITQVTLDGSTISSTTYTIDDANAGLLFRSIGWTSTQLGRHYVEKFPLLHGKRDWSFTYTAGYVTPGSTDSQRNLPYDIEMAAVQLTKALYVARRDDPMVIKQVVGEASETRANSQGWGVPPTVIRSLDKWRSIDIA
jgi:hypothetical protein